MAPAYGKMVAGLQHAERRLELPRLQACATTVAGLRLQACSTRCSASSAWSVSGRGLGLNRAKVRARVGYGRALRAPVLQACATTDRRALLWLQVLL